MQLNEIRAEQGITDEIIDIPTSFDGSWNSRGHRARDAVVCGIAEETSQVLDGVFFNNLCPQCTALESTYNSGTITYLDYLRKCRNHETQCQWNHDGSSQVSIVFGLSPRLHVRSLVR